MEPFFSFPARHPSHWVNRNHQVVLPTVSISLTYIFAYILRILMTVIPGADTVARNHPDHIWKVYWPVVDDTGVMLFLCNHSCSIINLTKCLPSYPWQGTQLNYMKR